MDERNRNRKSNPKSAIVTILLVLFFLLPTQVVAMLVVIAIFAAPIVLLIRSQLRKNGNSTQTRKNTAFDDCPQPFFCFHRDKGEHHVRKGREIDPWDRPDIDISKYRRR